MIKQKIAYPFDITKIKSYDDIPQLMYCQGHLWSTNIALQRIDQWYLGDEDHKIDNSPDYQRGHQWNEDQQRAYVEYVLRGGKLNTTFIFNQQGSLHNPTQPYELVDGLQRMTALHLFMNDKLKIFNNSTMTSLSKPMKRTGGKFPATTYNVTIQVMNLQTRAEILAFYLEHNSAGTPHSQKELDRVWKLYEQCSKTSKSK